MQKRPRGIRNSLEQAGGARAAWRHQKAAKRPQRGVEGRGGAGSVMRVGECGGRFTLEVSVCPQYEACAAQFTFRYARIELLPSIGCVGA